MSFGNIYPPPSFIASSSTTPVPIPVPKIKSKGKKTVKTIPKIEIPAKKRIRIESESETERKPQINEDQLVQDIIRSGIDTIADPRVYDPIPPDTMRKTTGNELTGAVRKRWVAFMKDYKKLAKLRGETDDAITNFGQVNYRVVAFASDKQKALDDIIAKYGHRVSTPSTHPEAQEPTIDSMVEDEVEPKLTEPQQKHIKGVIEILKKQPKLKADIKRTITEELTKGSINPAQFHQYVQEIENVMIEKEAPLAIRGKTKTPKIDKSKKKEKVVTL